MTAFDAEVRRYAIFRRIFGVFEGDGSDLILLATGAVTSVTP